MKAVATPFHLQTEQMMSFILHVSPFSGLPLDVLQFASTSCSVWPKAAVRDMWLHQCKHRGIIAFLDLLFMLLLM